ncbi:MAG TPA: ornithine cyclodeaminase family protein [Burkholderiales bacterium]|nr:ornithine cyclodeaminase family protein [Burkholderiales bacterium]
MAVTLGYEALRGALSMREAIDLLERAFAHEAAGEVQMSPKFVTDFKGGAMRILFAADSAAGYCAIKAYHNIQGAGVRYVVSLYRLKDGELLALLDGRHITDLRTGAASGVIASKVTIPGAVTVGLIGSGHQAATQLEALAAVYSVRSAAVFSPTAANREAFARRMSERLGFPVSPVDSAQAAVRGHPVVAAASSARGAEPVVRGEWLTGCRLLCAVGNTRAQFAEVDVRCFEDARLTVVDSIHALEEAGELKRAIAAGALPESKRATLGQVVTGAVGVPGTGLVVFKSVGTALQDLALAARYYELIGATAGVPTAADLASVK